MICDACRQSTSGRCWVHSAEITLPAADRPPVSGEPRCRCCGPNADCTCRRPGYHQYPHKDFCAVNLPPVSGEPRTPEFAAQAVELMDGWYIPVDESGLWYISRCRAEASTGAALDVERLRRIENTLLRSAGFFPWEDPHGEAWIHRDDEGYVMDREQAVNDALARLAEQEGEG